MRRARVVASDSPYYNPSISRSSNARIETFVDWFIRSESVEYLTSDRDSDFINEPERAARCYDAAENGADGKTHAEVIQDWRDAFGYWIDENHGSTLDRPLDRFEAAVRYHFDKCEEWHEKAGSLYQEVG